MQSTATGELLARCGIDVETTNLDRTADALRSHRLHQELAGALHWWALHRRRVTSPTRAWRPLLELADRCDLDPGRAELRQAFLVADTLRLQGLAATPAAIEMPPETIDLLGRFLVGCGDRQTAVALLRRAHLRHPYDYELCHELASLLAGEPVRPLREVTGLMTIGAALRPKSAHALVDLALALVDEQRFEEARPVVARALALDASYGRSWYCVSLVRERDADLEGALTAMREHARLTPDGATPRLLLSRLLERTGRGDEALAACRQAVAASPRWGDGLMMLGRLLFERGALAEAIEMLEKAVPLVRERGPTCALLGGALSASSLHQRAIDPLREAQRLLPDNAYVAFHLGCALAATGQLEEAVRQLTMADEWGKEIKDWPYPPTFLAHAKQLQGLEPELAEFLRSDFVPEPDIAVLLGDLAMSKGELRAAMRLFAAACDERPGLESVLAERRGRAAARLAFLGSSTTIDAAERARCAGESLRFLQTTLQHHLGAGRAMPADQLRVVLSAWTLAPEFVATRRDEGLDWLPAADRAAWRMLWIEVDRALTVLQQ